MKGDSDYAALTRTLKIIKILSSGIKFTRNEIIQKSNISERTFYRTMDAIRNAGFIIDTHNGYYSIEKNNYQSKDISSLLSFSEEESYILQEAIYSIDATTKNKENLIAKLSALYDNERIMHSFVGKENSSKIKPINQAIQNKLVTKLIGYSSGNSSLVSDRIIEPFRFTHNFDAIWGFEIDSHTCKLFKTARIKQVEILNKSWQFETLHKANYVDCFRMSDAQPKLAVFDMDLMAKSLLVEEYPLAEKHIKIIADGHYRFEGEIAKWEGIGRFILSLPKHISNINPPELKSYIKEQINIFLQPNS